MKSAHDKASGPYAVLPVGVTMIRLSESANYRLKM
jgi:hypothetical protein